MQIHHKPTKILLLGRSGSGKTTYMLRWVKATDYRYVFVFDHKREFQTRLNFPPLSNEEEMITALERGEKYINFVPDVEWPGQKEDAFAFFSEWVFEMAKVLNSSCLFVCDEVNRFISPHVMGWEFKQTIEDGRLQGLDFIGTAHGANALNSALKGQLTEIVALNCRDRLQLKFLTEAGFDEDEIKGLKTGEFIVCNMEDESYERGRLFSSPAASPPPEAEARENNIDDREETEQTTDLTTESNS